MWCVWAHQVGQFRSCIRVLHAYTCGVRVHVPPRYICTCVVRVRVPPMYMYTRVVRVHIPAIYMCTCVVCVHIPPRYICTCVVRVTAAKGEPTAQQHVSHRTKHHAIDTYARVKYAYTSLRNTCVVKMHVVPLARVLLGERDTLLHGKILRFLYRS